MAATTTPRRSPRLSRGGDDSPVVSRSTENSPLRKMHCCKTCGKPRSGHPRSGCPNASPSVSASPPKVSSVNGRRMPLEEQFKALQIDVDARAGMGHLLGVPLRFKDEPVSTTSAIAFLHAYPLNERHCLELDSPSSSQDTRPASPPPIMEDIPSSRTHRSRRLAPTLSQQEQQMFLDRARKTAQGDVTILQVAADSVPELVAEAQFKQLAVRVITPPSAPVAGTETESTSRSRWVIFGRDVKLVNQIGDVGAKEPEAVRNAFNREMKNGRYPVLAACGAGAVAGAVATWTGLAFG